MLSRADSLAAAGDEAAAKKIYVRLNELKPGTVVNAARRARGERIWRELSAFNATDRAGVLAGMERAGEYDGLRRAEDLLPLPEQTQLRLCRRGAVFGKTRRALPFCEGAIQLLPRDGAAHDSRGLARALLGDLRGARADFMAARDWLEDPGWRAKRQAWINALDAGRNPITPEVLQEIAREELGCSAAPPNPKRASL